ncbi:hypothetical protein UFOVP181_111 [uncultured Caudovirales phage]|uniref:Uncharacterized protein n=1 Tax=uncultured Caudovirales phage TaxID=2100421 RepID=A0A6J5KYT9_9CAUD|nr:hypothetical protein UFOVP57_51 [uncultured Caudovirales phage]CAB5208667.1 hypothetical protein UFOVP181_111 [uncultured Caudovirales phage]
MILAWLLLATGLTISAVAIYYSVVGLAAIFSAAFIPIIIMGGSLEIAKLVCASWLKANWYRVPRLLKIYMTTAVIVLMLITSMGIFGFLSKAHSDQSLVSGDVMSKIAVYDEKIKTAKDNIDANRKALKQMDEAVDQVMARSTTEGGADKAVAIRRGQAKERSRLQAEIASEQKIVAQQQELRAPIAAEVRKVEAEVGPIKYIAAFVYGATDESILEKAVTWVIITIIVVFDPLAVIMLLAAQMSFAWLKKPEEETVEELIEDEQDEPVKARVIPDTSWMKPNKFWPFPAKEQTHTLDEVIGETPATALGGDITAPEESIEKPVLITRIAYPESNTVIPPVAEESELDKWNKMIDQAEKAVEAEKAAEAELVRGEELLQSEEEPAADSKKKTYMTKDQTGHIQVKSRE